MIAKSKGIIKKANSFVKKTFKSFDGYEIVSLPVDLSTLSIPNFKLEQSEREKPIEQLLKVIDKHKGKPCIYLFEIESGDTKKIIKKYEKLKRTNKSALKNEINYNTNCLYIGKSANGIAHRMKVHFGYRDTSENGLQLLHWVKNLDLSLKIHFIFLKPKLFFLLPLYERRLNQELTPLIGHL
jgi:hypothetical protein